MDLAGGVGTLTGCGSPPEPCAWSRIGATITMPVIGGLRAKENTRRVQRHVASGRAQVLNMTLSQRWGRLFVSVSYALRTPPPHAPRRAP